MSTRLIILGLLQQRNLHGYEIKKVIEEHMGDWTSIAFGSIYFALAKLTKEGLLRKVSVGKQGNRPSRTVYGISAAGRKEFRRMLERLWGSPERQFFSFDLALFFRTELPPKTIKRCLQLRITHAKQALQYLHQHKAEAKSGTQVPRIAETISDHTIVHLEAEVRWLETPQEEKHETRTNC